MVPDTVSLQETVFAIVLCELKTDFSVLKVLVQSAPAADERRWAETGFVWYKEVVKLLTADCGVAVLKWDSLCLSDREVDRQYNWAKCH